jgi:hypothetical protein
MAVTLKTWGEQLAEVQEAITAVLSSQRYEINGRVMQKADLEWLHKRANYLENKLATEGDIIAGSVVTRGSALVSFE